MKKLIAISLSCMMAFAILPSNVDNHTIYGAESDDEISSKEAKTLGEFYGTIDGYTSGYMFYLDENKDAEYTQTLSSDYKKYDSLNNYVDNKAKSAFKIAYDSAYEEYFDLAKNFSSEQLSIISQLLADNSTPDTLVSMAVALATKEAELNASVDYAQGIACAPDIALGKYESEKSITDRFYLNKFALDEQEVKDFIDTIEETYKSVYEITYYTLTFEFLENNINFTPIDNFNTDFSYVLNTDTTGSQVNITFPTGSVLGYGYIGGYKERKPLNYDSSRFSFVDYDFYIDAYNINNFNRQEYIHSYKDFTMSIDHNLVSDNIGIYEYKNGAWQYLLTNISADSVSHTFPDSDYYGGRYCLFVEPNYKTFGDIYFSPFYDEIYTYARRGVLYGTSTKYNPTAYITRGDLAYMINGVLNPNNLNNSNINFTDVPNTSPYNTSANFVYSNGYINGVSSTTFGVNDKITYNQLQTIISRMTGQYFNMSSVFNEMKNDRFYKSEGISDMNAFVTKEEAVYIIYSVLQ